MKYYSIHFWSEETGEDFKTGVFCDKDEAMSSRLYDNGGYGHVEVVEVSREEALDALNEDIKIYIDEAMSEYGITYDDETYLEEWFIEEAWSRVEEKEPGWQLLDEEYFCFK